MIDGMHNLHILTNPLVLALIAAEMHKFCDHGSGDLDPVFSCLFVLRSNMATPHGSMPSDTELENAAKELCDICFFCCSSTCTPHCEFHL